VRGEIGIHEKEVLETTGRHIPRTSMISFVKGKMVTKTKKATSQFP